MNWMIRFVPAQRGVEEYGVILLGKEYDLGKGVVVVVLL